MDGADIFWFLIIKLPLSLIVIFFLYGLFVELPRNRARKAKEARQQERWDREAKEKREAWENNPNKVKLGMTIEEVNACRKPWYDWHSPEISVRQNQYGRTETWKYTKYGENPRYFTFTDGVLTEWSI